MKKLFTLILSIMALVNLMCVPVFAHDFPSDISKWTKKDWKAWNKYWEEHDDEYYELYYGDDYRIEWKDQDRKGICPILPLPVANPNYYPNYCGGVPGYYYYGNSGGPSIISNSYADSTTTSQTIVLYPYWDGTSWKYTQIK